MFDYLNLNYEFRLPFDITNNWYMPNLPIPYYSANFINFNQVILFCNYPILNNTNIFTTAANNNTENSTSEIKTKKPKKEIKQETKAVNKTIQTNNNTEIDNSYMYLSLEQAKQKAKNDSNLELLKGGKNWSVACESFITDIPYAKKGTGVILDKVAGMIGEKLTITSALATGEKNNPHQKNGYESHHNAENPKLDIRTNGNGYLLAQKLESTGYFSLINVEGNHLDVQINPSKFNNFEAIA